MSVGLKRKHGKQKSEIESAPSGPKKSKSTDIKEKNNKKKLGGSLTANKIEKQAKESADDPAKTPSTKNKFIGKPTGKKSTKFVKDKKVEDFKKKFTPKDLKGDQTPQSTEKTDWNKLKKEKKELKLKRKKSKQLYEVSAEVKGIYEKLKCRSTENKKELVQDLYQKLKKTDCIKKFVMAHDTARIIQCLLKHASPELRTQISEELLPIVVDMSISKYSHFCVLRMIKYGSHNIRDKIIQSLYGNIVRLATHSVSNGIIDVIYLTWASNKQKAYMRQEFYGDIYKKSKDDSVKKLSDTYANMPSMKSAILGALKMNLDHAANKKLVDNCLIHFVLLEYLDECSEEQRGEMIALYSPLIPSIITTREGCKAAIICFWHSATKERRAIVKSLKEHLKKTVVHEQGHILILAIINTMDDTKATKKSIFDQIYGDLEITARTQWGRKVIEWFVQPADKECFHPQLISFLEEGLKYGKKDKEVRRKEILEQIQEPLAVKMGENPTFWLKNGHLGLTTGVILKNLDNENFEKAAGSLAEIVAQPDWKVNVKDDDENELQEESLAGMDEKTKKKIRFFTKGDEAAPETEKMLGIENPGLHIALKKIIKNDKERNEAGSPTFGRFLVEKLSSETLNVWVTLNRACFILLNIYENCGASDVQESVKKHLSEHVAELKKQKHTGAKLLIDKLSLKQ